MVSIVSLNEHLTKDYPELTREIKERLGPKGYEAFLKYLLQYFRLHVYKAPGEELEKLAP